MAEPIEKSEELLKELGERVRAGWQRLHPAKPEHLEAVRRALVQQMQEENAPVAEKTKQEKEQAAESSQRQHRHRHHH
jgi:hypothetical protein